jgi:lysophospholipase L1-like esterase
MNIAFLGDSLTAGWPGAAFLPLLQRRLPQHDLVNRGRAGDTVGDLLRRLQACTLDPVDAAFVWVGVNDVVGSAWNASEGDDGQGWSALLERIAADYDRLLAWTVARARRIVCVRPLVLEAEGSAWEARADSLGDRIAGLAVRRETVRAFDLRPAFAAAACRGEGPFTIDGVHFTDAGAAVVAEAFACVIVDEAGHQVATGGEGA